MSEDILTLMPPPADKRLAYGSDSNQFLDLRLPPGRPSASPLVINIHGGFWRARYNLDHAGHLCAALTAKGLVTANLEYRRVGNEGGGWPGTFSDIRAAHGYLIQNAGRLSINPEKVVVMGHSAGGQLALCLAAHEKSVSRAVSLAGVVDLRRAHQLHLSNDAVVEFLHGTPSEVPDHYREADPMEIAINRARQILIHGSADDIVPVEFSREYIKRKQSAREREDVRLIDVPGVGHFDLIDPRSEAWKVVEKSVWALLD